MARDTQKEAALKIRAAGAAKLPVFELVGRLGNSRSWNVYRCGRTECRKGFAILKTDTDKALKMCPHCFRCGRLPKGKR